MCGPGRAARSAETRRARQHGLIPMSEICAAAGVKTPAIDALIEIVRSMTGKDFAVEGRTLERLGLSGMDAPQILRVMEEGFS